MKVEQVPLIRQLKNASCYWEERQALRRKVEKAFKYFTGWIFAVPDLHEPFTRHDLVADYILPDIIDARKKHKVITVLGGDTMTLDMFSKFMERIHPSMTLELEMHNAKQLIQGFCDVSNDVIMFSANHETRFFKYVMRKMGQSIAQQLRDVGFDIMDWLKDKTKASNLKVIDDWFIRIGDGKHSTIAAHPHVNSVVAGKPIIWTLQYLMPRIDFEVLLMGHIHRCYKIAFRRHLGISCGYLSKMFDYGRKARFSSIARDDVFHLGYGKCYMKNGIVDFNSADFVLLDWEENL